MFSNFDFNVIERSWVYLFQTGMVFTLKLTGLAMVGGIVIGFFTKRPRNPRIVGSAAKMAAKTGGVPVTPMQA